VDIIVGVNLLREGLDIPECGLVAILDADKEGFLRSETSLIQTIGRAARNSEGRVILYADKITQSIQKALSETERRRELQIAYNQQHNITPTTVTTKIRVLEGLQKVDNSGKSKTELKDMPSDPAKFQKMIVTLRTQMHQAAKNLEFEEAAKLRDKIIILEEAALLL